MNFPDWYGPSQVFGYGVETKGWRLTLIHYVWVDAEFVLVSAERH